MGKTSRDKGKRGEREAAAAVSLHWNASGACRSQQFCGRVGDADLQGVKGLHCEVKRYSAIAAMKFLAQSEDEAAPGNTPIVLMREDAGEWTVMMRVADAPEFARKLLDLMRGYENEA